MVSRTHVSEVSVVDDDLDPSVCTGNLFENVDRPVLGSVIDKDQFECILRELVLEHAAHAFVKFADIFFFVVTAADYTDEWHADSLSFHTQRSRYMDMVRRIEPSFTRSPAPAGSSTNPSRS